MKISKRTVLVFIIFAVIAIFAACGTQTLSEQEYKNLVESITEEIQTAVLDFKNAVQKADVQDKGTLDEVLSKIQAAEEGCRKLRDLKAPKAYKEVQAELQKGADKYLEGFAKYKEAFSGLAKHAISQQDLDAALEQGSQAIKDGSEFFKSAWDQFIK